MLRQRGGLDFTHNTSKVQLPPFKLNFSYEKKGNCAIKPFVPFSCFILLRLIDPSIILKCYWF
jgi:hypothetical protein